MQDRATGPPRSATEASQPTTSADPRASGRDGTPGGQEPAILKIELLDLTGSPRLEGENEMHTRVLAETVDTLPPVLVHRETMRVIDGVHRVQAARSRGEDSIRALYFDGDIKAAFVRAVEANVSHGLPLSLADRRAAATRILGDYPEWSDRAIAAVAGMSATTVRSLRDRTTAHSEQLHTRVGADGKVRPLDASEGRRKAASLITERPHTPLREVASLAGVSVGTARDVRQRLREGEDPVPQGTNNVSPWRGTRAPTQSLGGPGRANRGLPQQTKPIDERRSPRSILDDLRKDPSLRYSELGRSLVRWLDAHVVDPVDLSKLTQSVPPHSAFALADLATGCARAWERAAQELMASTERVRLVGGD